MLCKVCGIVESIHLKDFEQLPVDMVGLNFYPPSPRYFKESEIKADKKIIRVGVFVNSPKDEILETAKTFQLDYAQLHGVGRLLPGKITGYIEQPVPVQVPVIDLGPGGHHHYLVACQPAGRWADNFHNRRFAGQGRRGSNSGDRAFVSVGVDRTNPHIGRGEAPK